MGYKVYGGDAQDAYAHSPPLKHLLSFLSTMLASTGVNTISSTSWIAPLCFLFFMLCKDTLTLGNSGKSILLLSSNCPSLVSRAPPMIALSTRQPSMGTKSFYFDKLMTLRFHVLMKPLPRRFKDWKDAGNVIMKFIPGIINPSDDLTKPLSCDGFCMSAMPAASWGTTNLCLFYFVCFVEDPCEVYYLILGNFYLFRTLSILLICYRTLCCRP